MGSTKYPYVNREISWLSFNFRVLQEAANKENPILERIRFLGIYANNLDEFFQVRVATLQRLINLHEDIRTSYYDDPQEILTEVIKIVKKQQTYFQTLHSGIIDELETQNVRIVDEASLTKSQREFVTDLYHNRLVNSLSPLWLSAQNCTRTLKGSAPYLIVKLSKPKYKDYMLLELPLEEFPRYIQLPSDSDVKYLIMLDDVVRMCLPDLLACCGFRKFEAFSVKIVRDSEFDFNQDIHNNPLDRVSEGLRVRYGGAPVKISYDRSMPQSLLSLLMLKLKVSDKALLFPAGRYNSFKDLMAFPNLGGKDWEYEPWTPAKAADFEHACNVTDMIFEKDTFLHCPYHSFSHYIRFLREASIDPDVRSIKATVYRLASNSKIVQALINAANNGKRVTAVVELLARFDESANINWAQRMQDAGIKVIFGVEGLKIHSKLTYIRRRDEDIVCIGTGNFHEGNASRYTDVFFFTSHKQIVADVRKVFNLIDQPFNTYTFKHLLVSPHRMRSKLYSMIKREVENAKQKKSAYILCKINHVTDLGIIRKLYEAAEVGVKIEMVVRGNCSMASTKNIRIVSIVDRYLEHSRIFIFGNGGDERCYISSADWMARNLDNRIEVAVPIYDPKIKEAMKNIVQYGLNDNVRARIVDAKGQNNFVQGKLPFRSQWKLYEHYSEE